MPQQNRPFATVLGVDRDADARPHVQVVSLGNHRRLERMQNRLGDAPPGEGVIARQDDRELVAAKARDGVGGPLEQPFQTRRDRAQYQVADGMPERVVHVLEVVEVHQQNRDPRMVALSGRNRLIETLVAHHAVGQLRQGIAVSKVHDPRFAAGNAVLHGAERRGQVADLGHAGRGRRGRIVACGNAARDAGELAHRPRDPARDRDARQDGHEDAGKRDEREPALQAPKRLERRGQRLLQHDDDAAAAARGHHDARDCLVAVRRVAVRVALHETLRSDVGQQRRAILVGERAGLQPPAIARLAAEERHVQSCQAPEVLRQAIVDDKPDHHPGDRRRRQHRHHDELVELAAN